LWVEVTQTVHTVAILMNRLTDRGRAVRNTAATLSLKWFQLHHKLSKCAWSGITGNYAFSLSLTADRHVIVTDRCKNKSAQLYHISNAVT